MGTIWFKWGAILPPVEGEEWVASNGALQCDSIIHAVDGNIHLWGDRQEHGGD